jgi:hypothetical protein
VHVFLEKLVKILISGSITQFDIDVYNKSTRHVFQNFTEFVALHYAFSKRNDTEYWKANNSRIFEPGMADLVPVLHVGFTDYAERKMFSGESDPHKGLVWIATGMNHHIVDQISAGNVEYTYNIKLKDAFADSFSKMEMNKVKWWNEAKKELSLFQWLLRYIHNS